MNSSEPTQNSDRDDNPPVAPHEAEGQNENASRTEAKSDSSAKPDLEDIRVALHIRELESKVKSYETRLADIREYVKKMEGEIENIRQRSARESQRMIDQRIGEFFIKLLNISDNFDLSLKTAESEKSALADGVRMIHSQFAQFLQQAGLERLSPKGEIFDPHQHEAIATQPTPIKEMDNVVLQEAKAGYRLKENILRPAQVVVGRFQSSDDQERVH
jgi:molecular chaperone GrpE